MVESILIIPLCGVGKRFKISGYKKHKSLLEIEKKQMLERIIGKFPKKTGGAKIKHFRRWRRTCQIMRVLRIAIN
mgnify:CR=1 FL=1